MRKWNRAYFALLLSIYYVSQCCAQDAASPNSQGSGNSQNQSSAGSQSSAANQSSPQQPTSNVSSNSQPNAALNSYLSSARRFRLARQPRMFGDWFGPSAILFVDSETPGPTNGLFSDVDFPVSSVRVGKISENNNALPVDRVFANYNFFHRAVQGGADGPVAGAQQFGHGAAHRWTVGVERTFFDGLTSLEARFVASDVQDFVHTPLGGGALGAQSFSPTMGNLAIVSKLLLIENDSTALAVGLGTELPTGGDLTFQSSNSQIQLENETVFLTPYFGLLKKPVDSPWFANFFLQTEVPLNSDGVTGVNLLNGTETFFGRFDPKTIMYVDLSVGRWLYEQPNGTVTGVAGFLEAHYSHSFEASDTLNGGLSVNGFDNDYTINPGTSNLDVVDLTFGFHIEIATQTKVRIAGVVPVGDQRTFNSEFGFQLTQLLQ